jgi:hypothetical protein
MYKNLYFKTHFFFPQFQLSSSASPKATLILSTQFFFNFFFILCTDFSLLPKYLYAGSFGSLSEYFFLSFSLPSVFNTLSFYLMLSFVPLTLCLSFFASICFISSLYFSVCSYVINFPFCLFLFYTIPLSSIIKWYGTVLKPANDHLIEFHLIEIVIFHLIESFN